MIRFFFDKSKEESFLKRNEIKLIYFQVGRPPKEEVGKDKEKKKSKKGSGNNKEEKVKLSATPLMNMPQEIIDMPVDPNEPTYCVCQQGNLFHHFAISERKFAHVM